MHAGTERPNKDDVQYEPPWLALARKNIGIREVPGPVHQSLIVKWWKMIKRGGIKDDETPWCSAFVGAMLEESGIQSTRFEGALSWATWGQHLPRPVRGAIAVLERQGGGHVAFVESLSEKGHVALLGGNQNNEVNIRSFPMARVIAWRWPKGVPVPSAHTIRITKGHEKSSTEA